MKKNSKHSKDIAYLRQLCCLGLSKEIVITEFLRAVRLVIPSENNVCTTLKPPFILDNHILGFDVSEMANLPLEPMAYFLTPECMTRSAAWFAQHPVFTDPSTIWGRDYYSSDPYNLIWRKLEQHHFLYAPVYQYGKPVALLGLFRPKQHSPFNHHEQALLPQLTPYISHALGTDNSKTILYSETVSSGMLIMNTNGELLFQSLEAKRLLALASYPILGVTEHVENLKTPRDYLFRKLKQICGNLDVIFQGKVAAPPSWSFTNSRGQFIFHAHWLDNVNQEPSSMMGINIELHEPQSLKLLRALQKFQLPPVQREVALLIAEGLSNDEICSRLHIKLTTVKDHVRRIFVKLDIDRRETLIPKLLATEESIKIISY
jgi:DNA-binding CsgD family transcriptional regulator